MAEVETKRKAAEPETKRAIEDLIQIYICPDNFCDFGSAHMSPETVCCSWAFSVRSTAIPTRLWVERLLRSWSIRAARFWYSLACAAGMLRGLELPGLTCICCCNKLKNSSRTSCTFGIDSSPRSLRQISHLKTEVKMDCRWLGWKSVSPCPRRSRRGTLPLICQARARPEEGGFPRLTVEDLTQIVRDGCAPSPRFTVPHFNDFAVSSFFDQCTGGELLVN